MSAVDELLCLLTQTGPWNCPPALMVTRHASIRSVWGAISTASCESALPAWTAMLQNQTQDFVQHLPPHMLRYANSVEFAHVIDPVVLACDIATNPTVCGTNACNIDFECRQLSFQLSNASPFVFAVHNSTWNVDAETAAFQDEVARWDGVDQALNVCTGISGASSGTFLREAADQAKRDGLDGIIAFAISFDKTCATRQRSIYPLQLRILNACGRVSSSSAATELLGLFRTELNCSSIPEEDLDMLYRAHISAGLNLILKRLSQVFERGVQLRFAAISKRVRLCIGFVCVDLPDAHVLCGTVQSWGHACLAHRESAKATTKKYFKHRTCKARTVTAYKEAYAALFTANATQNIDRKVQRYWKQYAGINLSRPVVRIDSVHFGLRA